MKTIFQRINKLALPLMVSYITNYLFIIGDQAIIGRTSIEGFAAVGIVANFLYLITGSIGLISVTLNIIGSKLLADQKKTEYQDLFNTCFTLTLIIGLLFQIFMLIFGQSLLSNVFNLKGLALDKGVQYIWIASLTLLLNMLIFIFSGIFKSHEKPKLLLYTGIIANVVNLFIDYALVFGHFGLPKLDVMGAAIGTVIGLLLQLALYWLALHKTKLVELKLLLKLRLIKKTFKTYIPLLVQDLLETSLFGNLLISCFSFLGTLEVASYTLLLSATNLVLFPAFAYSTGAATLLAKEKDKNVVRKYSFLSTILSAGSFLVFAGIFIVFANHIFGFITSDTSLVNHSVKFISMFIIIQCLNTLFIMFKAYLNTMGKEQWLLIFSIIGSVIASILAYFLVFIMGFDELSIYISIAIYYLFLFGGSFFKFKSLFNNTTPDIKEST